MFCKECGAEINDKASICMSCGVATGVSIKVSKDRTVFIILALLFGWFGVHKFYDGKLGMGIIYFLLAWTGIPFVVSLFEALEAACQSEEEFALEH